MMKRICFVLALVSALMMACTSNPDLEAAVAAASVGCPRQSGEGMVCTKVIMEGQSVVYVYMYDELMLPVAAFKDPIVKAMLRDEIVDYYRNEASKEDRNLVKQCLAANYDIVYRFVSCNSEVASNVLIDPHKVTSNN